MIQYHSVDLILFPPGFVLYGMYSLCPSSPQVWPFALPPVITTSLCNCDVMSSYNSSFLNVPFLTVFTTNILLVGLINLTLFFCLIWFFPIIILMINNWHFQTLYISYNLKNEFSKHALSCNVTSASSYCV